MMPNCPTTAPPGERLCRARDLILSGGSTQCTNCMRRASRPPGPKCTSRVRPQDPPCGMPSDPGWTIAERKERRGHTLCTMHQRIRLGLV